MRDRPAFDTENQREEQLVRMVEIDCMLDTLLRNAESGLRRINDLEPEFYFDDFGKKSSKFQKYDSSFTSNDLSFAFDDDDDNLSNASFSTVDSNATVRNMSDDSFTKLKSSISMSSADSAIDVTPPSPFDLKKELATLRTRNNGLHEQVSDMQHEMSSLQREIKESRINAAYLRQSARNIIYPNSNAGRTVTFTMKKNVDKEKAQKAMENLQREIQRAMIPNLRAF
ncbi:unnamed protein product [Oikopleura dioica]|uniref:Uncharacterized protein n=1 Tax=Oikopleura dioica TaxID=34765 RepID=E4YX81_OIKDI|nr:unnamed protein product [Oikopleura dioica]